MHLGQGQCADEEIGHGARAHLVVAPREQARNGSTPICADSGGPPPFLMGGRVPTTSSPKRGRFVQPRTLDSYGAASCDSLHADAEGPRSSTRGRRRDFMTSGPNGASHSPQTGARGGGQVVRRNLGPFERIFRPLGDTAARTGGVLLH